MVGPISIHIVAGGCGLYGLIVGDGRLTNFAFMMAVLFSLGSLGASFLVVRLVLARVIRKAAMWLDK